MLLFGRTQMVPQFSIADSVGFFMAHGFDGVEISILTKQFAPREEFFAPGFPAQMKAALHEAGAKGYSVSAHMDYTQSEENFRYVERALEVAAKLEAPYLIINGAVKREGEAYLDQYAAMIEKTRLLAKKAHSLGLKLAIEYEPNFVLGSTPQLLRAIEEIGMPNVGINCDIGHVFLCDEDPMEAIELSAPYILQCHVENMAKGVHNHLVVWEGDMDLAAYIAKLREVGFDGALGLDLYAYDYAQVCGENARFLRRLIDAR